MALNYVYLMGDSVKKSEAMALAATISRFSLSEEIVTDYVSIGDYVLTGGELPAMVMIDSISRLVPGVLHNDDSAGDESFENGLLEYPQYTRPPVFLDKEVPEVLLSGHHENIRKWRHEQSVKRTKERRPDLWEAYEKEMKEKDGGK